MKQGYKCIITNGNGGETVFTLIDLATNFAIENRRAVQDDFIEKTRINILKEFVTHEDANRSKIKDLYDALNAAMNIGTPVTIQVDYYFASDIIQFDDEGNEIGRADLNDEFLFDDEHYVYTMVEADTPVADMTYHVHPTGNTLMQNLIINLVR